MSTPLRKSTASQVMQFTMIDNTDFKTPKTGLSIANTDIKLIFEGGTTQTSKNSGGATEIGSTGTYYCTFDATDTATLGRLHIDIQKAGALPYFKDTEVLPALVWDALYAASGGAIMSDLQTIKTQAVTCSAGVTVNPSVGATANTITHLNTIFDTDYSSIYDTTNKAFLSKLGNFAMGGSSLALTTGAIVCSTITASGAVAFQSTFIVTGATTFTGNLGLSDGLTIAAPSTTNRAGITITGNGTGAGIITTGGGTGNGMTISGGASGHGLSTTGVGTTKHGIIATGSTTTGAGLNLVGGGTSGDGLLVTTTSGHGFSVTATGASKHGAIFTGGSSGTSDGFKVAAGTGGVGFRLDTLSSSGLVTFDSHTVTNAETHGSTVLGNTTMGTLTQTGAVSWGATTYASMAITGAYSVGTTTTFTGAVTATNASNDIRGIKIATGGIVAASFGAGAIDATAIAADAITDAKVASDVTIASVTGAVGSVTGAVGSVTGNVGGNVTGSVGSIATGGIIAASFASGAIDAAAIATDALGALELAAGAASEIATAVRTELTTELAHMNADISSRMATYTQPTGFLAASFPTDPAGLTNLASAHGAGSWATATGFSVAGDAMTLTAAYDAAKTAATQASVDAISTTIGAAGIGLTEAGGTGDQFTAVPWNAAWDAEVQSEVDDALKAALTEGYRTLNGTGSVAQLLYEISAHLGRAAITSTTKTLYKVDGTTPAKTSTLNSATAPTSITEAS